MITKAELRRVISLQDKKDRDRVGLYVVWGDKLVREAAALGVAEAIYAVGEWIEAAADLLAATGCTVAEISVTELHRMSGQRTPNGALAVVRKPRPALDWEAVSANLVLALDAVQDPGNVGSLLRVATWFGIDDIVSSPQSADVFQPKSVQASMGALFHVRLHVLDLVSFLAEARSRGLPVYGATLDGISVYDVDLEPRGVILFGNESVGLPDTLLGLASQHLRIPPWRESGPGRDSLNVAMAAAVLCAEFRRRACAKAALT